MMDAADVEQAVRRRLEIAGVVVDGAAAAALAAYLVVLARWNRRINLTAFALDQLSDHAIDRLIVEPVDAAALVRADDRLAVDVGSGGGSPALPLKIVRPHLRVTLVEARARKSAFLREAVRELQLADVDVETRTFDRRGIDRLNGQVGIVTMRAVRADDAVLAGVRQLLAPGGRLLWFRDPETDTGASSNWEFGATRGSAVEARPILVK